MVDRNALTGVSLMVIVAACSAFDSVLVRHLSHNIHPFFMGFTRASFGLLAMLPWILKNPGMLSTRRHWLHALRAGLKLASLVALFAALASAPLATVTAIGFAAPVFVTVGAWFFFREAPNSIRIAAVITGFVGVVVLLEPGGGSLNMALFLAVVSALLTATIQLMLKHMGSREKSDTLVAWNLIATVPIAFVPAIFFWSNPTPVEWALLALQGAIGALNQTLVTKAFQYGDASLIAPIDFLRLPFVAAAAFLFFNEIASRSTWIGGAFILVAVLMMAMSSRRKDPQP